VVVDHADVLRLVAGGAVVVDVLPAREYERSHIRGAVHFPPARVIADARLRLPHEAPIVVYCRDTL
jgi:rhodanese-related sulfurtransferase